MSGDTIEIEILDDGTIKTITDRVSAPNHANAETFLLQMARLSGGQVKRERRGKATTDATKTQEH